MFWPLFAYLLYIFYGASMRINGHLLCYKVTYLTRQIWKFCVFCSWPQSCVTEHQWTFSPKLNFHSRVFLSFKPGLERAQCKSWCDLHLRVLNRRRNAKGWGSALTLLTEWWSLFWPTQSQTSPKRTSRRCMVCEGEASNVAVMM